MNYEQIVQHILSRIGQEKGALKKSWESASPVMNFVVDDLLPEDFVRKAAVGFPYFEKMTRIKSFREQKSSSADLEVWSQETRDVFMALQDARVLALMGEITGINELMGDPSAYAGGISCMISGDFLNPHLDNASHPKIQGYRRLNALFYVSEGWCLENGGNLELWSRKMKVRKEICSSFNRLVVMNTNRESLHSVNRVLVTGKSRLCISNYYFTAKSPHGYDYHHITSFRGRPDEKLKDLYLQGEAILGSKLQGLLRKR